MTNCQTPMLLVTANVGSIFEKTDLMPIWINEFVSKVEESNALFIAINCQEVGGKAAKNSLNKMNDFASKILYHLQNYDRSRIYFDQDYTNKEKYTAMGCIFLIHKDLADVLQYDFSEIRFNEVVGHGICCGVIDNVPQILKKKYPLDYFPGHKWSRKGFIHSKWQINGSIFDLVNIHLFHDDDNSLAMGASPSIYREYRKHALEYAIGQIEENLLANEPYFLFGDFNFRLDAKLLAAHITGNAVGTRSKNDPGILEFKSSDGQVLMAAYKKHLDYANFNEFFSSKNIGDLRQFDVETHHFSDKLFEYDVTFPLTFKFCEDIKLEMTYKKSRVPAWCDKILLSLDAHKRVSESEKVPEYGMLGLNKCMGDHKPIFLRFDF